jgi:uncharacterized membrane protein YgdD (TMEM256/DUF423 family)
MKRWEKGRFLALLLPNSWALLPELNVLRIPAFSPLCGTFMIVGWLCFHVRIRLS